MARERLRKENIPPNPVSFHLEGVKASTPKEMDLQARIENTRVTYGYEYLGNTMRLVITPLTDRWYRTMMGAIDLMYGGAPEGPAGTGKTETVKHLSKAIAIQCVVFNCSDGLDYLAMAKSFKGSRRLWLVANVDKFLFEGTFIKLNPSANVFITMNPGYAGCAELPDNLKALFRPCAMMVPHYALISEIRLYSFGFANARILARMLTQVLQLSSEQLSSQKHYDYGMRAVNSILVACGVLRQQLGNDLFWMEVKIVLRSVQDVNLPKFTTDDLPLFRGITSDLFPGANLPTPDHGPLLATIDAVCERISIVPDVVVPLECKPEFKMKVVQYYKTVQVRHGLMIVGQTGSGKSCVVHTLATAMTACQTESDGKVQQCVHIHTMNPTSNTSGQLYSNFDLEEASPATVSRVGMVFLEPKNLGWEVLLRTWLRTRMPSAFAAHHAFVLETCLWLVPPMLFFVEKNCIVPTPVTFLEHGASLLCLCECALYSAIESSEGLGSDLHKVLEGLLVKSVVWTIGACVDAASRRLFDRCLREFTTGKAMEESPAFLDFLSKSPHCKVSPSRVLGVCFPEDGIVYDYRFDTKRMVWSNWIESSGAFAIPRDAQFALILVPTIDTERNAWLLDILLRRNMHVLCTGDTGTGKSVSLGARRVQVFQYFHELQCPDQRQSDAGYH